MKPNTLQESNIAPMNDSPATATQNEIDEFYRKPSLTIDQLVRGLVEGELAPLNDEGYISVIRSAD